MQEYVQTATREVGGCLVLLCKWLRLMMSAILSSRFNTFSRIFCSAALQSDILSRRAAISVGRTTRLARLSVRPSVRLIRASNPKTKSRRKRTNHCERSSGQE